MGSLPNPLEPDHAKDEDSAPSLPPHEEPELLDPEKALEEFFEISRNVSGQPYPGQDIEELLEKTDWKRVREELTCPENPPCTDLLVDPVGVLNNENRWPKRHLCRARFLQRSTHEWASQLMVPTTHELREWTWEWPLPIGMQALGLKTFSWELYNLMPFEGHEAALWAIHIDAGAFVLDLFGLGTPYGQGDERAYEIGELGYRMQGRGRGPLDLVARADRWWTQFRGEKITGRPYGSRRWASLDEFKKDVRSARDTLRIQRRKATQENVAEALYTDARQIRRELERHGIASWKDFLKML
jgi:hypothetical protein